MTKYVERKANDKNDRKVDCETCVLICPAGVCLSTYYYHRARKEQRGVLKCESFRPFIIIIREAFNQSRPFIIPCETSNHVWQEIIMRFR